MLDIKLSFSYAHQLLEKTDAIGKYLNPLPPRSTKEKKKMHEHGERGVNSDKDEEDGEDDDDSINEDDDDEVEDGELISWLSSEEEEDETELVMEADNPRSDGLLCSLISEDEVPADQGDPGWMGDDEIARLSKGSSGKA
jgi:hypothetical protein